MKRTVLSSPTLTLGVALLLGSAAAGQARTPASKAVPPTKPAEVVSTDAQDLLWSRGKEVLHNGDPLFLRGVELGENSFRESTPALLKSDYAVAYVDLDTIRERKIAMYESRAGFDSAPALSAGPPLGSSPPGDLRRRALHEGAPSSSPAALPEPEPEPPRSWVGLLLGATATLLVALLGWRRFSA